MTRPAPDRRTIVNALTYHDPALARLATTSPTFAHGLDQIVAVACAAVAGLAATAEDTDRQHDAALDAALNPDPNLLGRTRFGSGAP